MPGGLARRDVRAHRQALAYLDSNEDYAQAQMDAIDRLRRTALLYEVQTSRMCDEAIRLCPSGAARYEYLAMTGTMEMAEVIHRFNRRR